MCKTLIKIDTPMSNIIPSDIENCLPLSQSDGNSLAFRGGFAKKRLVLHTYIWSCEKCVYGKVYPVCLVFG